MPEVPGSGKTYGGFFPIDLPRAEPPAGGAVAHLADGRRFYDGRSAIAELIRANGIADVLMPGYICPVVYKAVENAGAAWRTYKVNPGFRTDWLNLSYTAKQGTLLIVPAYFGVYMPDLDALEEMMDISGCRVLLDYAQALYAPCPPRFAAVYSPRKFLGVPDGGILVVGGGSRLKEPPVPLLKVDQTVFGDRMSCHGIRLEYPHGDALDSFRRLEREMPLGPYRMSDLASTLFDAFDHDSACAARRANYEALSAALPDGPPPCPGVPLCFPFPVEPDSFNFFRRNLISKGVFVPHYWPDLPEGVEDLGRTLLALPVDQRYTTEDMAAVAALLMAPPGDQGMMM
ncbi:MAG TPA: hypothetical protein PLF04_08510 [Candidatus Fermentibacter daniensis]|jgi:hypothetical protein|nr:MAG: hypothetical protein AO395_02525 [Candidatus Fermentibacter daniensis]MBP7720575.1 hypothetical protein [Candidatus Fermentibacter sp.]KZD19747.1 MAG: hypothetical protein AO396_01660 [Candidatus Fermentibacter daniensis]MCC6871593.1 hypothetical protein [Candidatus Fermentibacter sp.]NLI02596.1 hypothetical protein [Candidatus Fermentibacter daniensis]